jgi:hypothetical protein
MKLTGLEFAFFRFINPPVMKQVIPAIAMFCMMSCSSFQYGTISSALPAEPDGTVKFENDTIRVSYSFSGENCPLTVRVYNKTSQPLTVHWDKSSVIVNNKNVPFRENVSTISATSESSISRVGIMNSSTGSIQGIIQNAEPISYVPPSSFVESTVAVLDSLISINKVTQQYLIGPDGRRLQVARYNEDNSPITLRSYLTYSLNGNSSSSHIDNSFWLSAVINTRTRPHQFEGYRSRHDMFFTRKVKYTGLIVGATAGLLATVLLVGEAIDQTNDVGY